LMRDKDRVYGKPLTSDTQVRSAEIENRIE
jgi:hypothetical protein